MSTENKTAKRPAAKRASYSINRDWQEAQRRINRVFRPLREQHFDSLVVFAERFIEAMTGEGEMGSPDENLTAVEFAVMGHIYSQPWLKKALREAMSRYVGAREEVFAIMRDDALNAADAASAGNPRFEVKPDDKHQDPSERQRINCGDKFKALVLKWRIERKLSQRAAAAALGVPFRTLQDWEYGKRMPRGLARELIVQRLERT
jgi:DNA-binding transcriptional regulator YiaG